MISCIIPTKDRRQYIGAAIRSVMAQRATPCEIELIVVDDGSTDGTAQWIKARFPGVNVVQGGVLGPGGARNKGALYASGDVLMFLDSDDIWHTYHAAALYEALKQQRVQAAYGVTKTIDLETRESFLIPSSRDVTSFLKGDIAKALYRWCFFVPSSFAVKREVFFDLGGFPEGELGEDWQFFLTCAARCEFGAIPRVITTRRLNTTSICKKMASKEKFLALMEGLEKIMSDRNLLDREAKRLFTQRRQFIEKEGENWKSVQEWYLAMSENGLIPSAL